MFCGGVNYKQKTNIYIFYHFFIKPNNEIYSLLIIQYKIMVRKCIACNNFYVKGVERSFHPFPRNFQKRRLWFSCLSIVPTDNWMRMKYLYLCSDHFTDSDMVVKPLGRKYLKKDATPQRIRTVSNEVNDDVKVFDHSVFGPRIFKTEILEAEMKNQHNIMPSNIGFAYPSISALPAIKIEPSDVSDISGCTALPFNTVSEIKMEDTTEYEQFETFMQQHQSDLPSGQYSGAGQSSLEMDRYSSSATETASEAEMEYERFKKKSTPPKHSFQSTSSPGIRFEEGVAHQKSVSRSPRRMSSSSTDTASEVADYEEEEEEMARRRTIQTKKPSCSPDPTRKLKRLYYIGDIKSDDFQSASVAKTCLRIASRKISEQKQKISGLLKERHKLKTKVKCLNSLLRYLVKNNFITEGAHTIIQGELT